MAKHVEVDDTNPDAVHQKIEVSPELAAVVGDGPMARGEVTSKIWDYIRSNKLQNPQNKREILADSKLEPIFGAKKVTMFEMNKHLARHLS